jgi:glycosyltransferase involved in cell wall biosynthesis
MDINEEIKMKKRIALVRGPNLNKWEMQNYEPLMDEFDLVGYTTYKHKFETSSIKFPVKKLYCIDEIFDFIPKYRGLIKLIMNGMGYMIGLVRELENVDIVHSAETFNIFTEQCINAKKRNKRLKVILTIWENIPFSNEENKIIKERKRKVIKETDYFIAVTQQSRECLLLEGVPEEKISVIPMGVNTDIFCPKSKNIELMQKIGLDRDDFVILFVGSMIWEKGIFDLLFACKKLLSTFPSKNIKFCFLGDGPSVIKLKELSIEMGLNKNVVIQSGRKYSEIADVHNLADIFVLPSIPTKTWQEQLGMVLIESMACGKPVISTYCGSIPEVIGDAGILVPPGNFLAIADAIRFLMSNEDYRTELGIKARKRVIDKFNSVSIASKIRDIYDIVLKSK